MSTAQMEREVQLSLPREGAIIFCDLVGARPKIWERTGLSFASITSPASLLRLSRF
jgi:hypothetical protein